MRPRIMAVIKAVNFGYTDDRGTAKPTSDNPIDLHVTAGELLYGTRRAYQLGGATAATLTFRRRGKFVPR